MDKCRRGGALCHSGILLAISLVVLLPVSGRADESVIGQGPDQSVAGPEINPQPVEEAPQRRADYEGEPIDTGFLFVDGAYLPPPYIVSRARDRILINGATIATSQPRESATGGRRGHERGPGNGRRRFRVSVRELEEVLQSDGTVVLFENEQPALLYDLVAVEFLEALVLSLGQGERRSSVAGFAGEDADRELWDEFARGFTPPADLVSRVETLKAQYDRAERANVAQIDGVRRSSTLLYPLTVLGLVISALSLGNLLLSRPPAVLSWRETDASRPVTQMVVHCTAFVVALSVLDLVYTVLAVQANQMHELNPLGGRLIHDPLLLAVFKGLATLVGVGILIALRRYRGAQMASWWLCLICTVVTFRWLTFNSLFMT